MTTVVGRVDHAKIPTHLEEETESHPLIVFDMLLVSVVSGLVDSGVRHVHAHPFPVSGTQGVRGMDPTVCVQDILGDVPGVHAHDRWPDVLPCRHDEGEGEQGHDGDPVV